MHDVATCLNAMVEARIISTYAVFGAVAQMRYTEAVATLDADILVALPDESSLDLLRPIYAFCKDWARIVALREAQACSDDEIAALAAKHDLAHAWSQFQRRFDAD